MHPPWTTDFRETHSRLAQVSVKKTSPSQSMTRLRQNACTPVIATIALGEQHDLELAAKDRSLKPDICDTMHLATSKNTLDSPEGISGADF